MSELRTEFPFVLPKGLLDAKGELHREGAMRLATARDELESLRDAKVADADDPYLAMVVLARVVTRLGSRTNLKPSDLEGLFAGDLAHLQDVYGIINYGSPEELADLLTPTPGPGAPAPLMAVPDRPQDDVATAPAATESPAPASTSAAAPTTVPAPATGQTPSRPDPDEPAAPVVAATADQPKTPTPISDAARNLMGRTDAAWPAAADPAPDAPDDDDMAEYPQPSRPPRRGRIEEVGKSTGIPGGMR